MRTVCGKLCSPLRRILPCQRETRRQALPPGSAEDMAIIALIDALSKSTHGAVIVVMRTPTGEVVPIAIGALPSGSGEALPLAGYKAANPFYQPLDGSNPIDLQSLTAQFKRGPLAVMREVFKTIQRIQRARSRDPQFVPLDKDMEFIRSAVFALEASGISESQFCDEGLEIISQLRALIAEYEQRNGAATST